MNYTKYRRRPAFNQFFPVFENILHDVANTPVKDLVDEKKSKSFRPKANVIELDDQFKIDLALPGVTKENVTITVEDKHLIVSSDLKVEDDLKYTFKEFELGQFERKFILPKNINRENIGASFDSGILTISLLKKEEAKPRSITIK